VRLSFIKMHAHGDDFVVVDARGRRDPLNPEVARRLGDRKRGIGFNQLAVVLDCADAAARLLFWNPDGTNLSACGSATRGVADILMREASAAELVLRTERGLLACRRHGEKDITVDMGEPLLGWDEVPLASACDTNHLPLPGDPAACSMGNPHCTFFFEDLSEIEPWALGPPIEQHPLFPQRTNVHFVQVLDRSRIRLRIWERGGGVPAGSGSCSCAAAVAAIRRGLTDDSVTVVCDGGSVHVKWDGVGGVKLTGGVVRVFEGEAAPTLLS
jgi:diaminopimelate epimerase